MQRHEAEAMKADETIIERVLRSYRLMLDFYGMRLEDSETGLLARSDKNHSDRYRNLVRECCCYIVISIVSLTAAQFLQVRRITTSAFPASSSISP